MGDYLAFLRRLRSNLVRSLGRLNLVRQTGGRSRAKMARPQFSSQQDCAHNPRGVAKRRSDYEFIHAICLREVVTEQLAYPLANSRHQRDIVHHASAENDALRTISGNEIRQTKSDVLALQQIRVRGLLKGLLPER